MAITKKTLSAIAVGAFAAACFAMPLTAQTLKPDQVLFEQRAGAERPGPDRHIGKRGDHGAGGPCVGRVPIRGVIRRNAGWHMNLRTFLVSGERRLVCVVRLHIGTEQIAARMRLCNGVVANVRHRSLGHAERQEDPVAKDIGHCHPGYFFQKQAEHDVVGIGIVPAGRPGQIVDLVTWTWRTA